MPDEEINLNEKALKQSQLPILKEPETFNPNEKEMIERVKRIGSELAKHSARPYINYSFLIADIDEPNAFALPGGVIMITRGLYELTESDIELALAIAHEIIHINCFHTIFNIRTEQNWQIFGAIMGAAAAVAINSSGKNGSDDNKFAVGIISGLSIYQIIAQIEMKGYKKKQEFEADKKGLELAYRLTDFKRAEAYQLFNKLWDLEIKEQGGKFSSMSRTHPAWKERLKELGYADKNVKK
jgi:predicted Zn-dependent protease